MTPTINSYFSGGGLLDIGLHQAGINVGRSYEIDATCCKVQAENLGDHVLQADITEKLVAGDDCDTMVFTYPCTKYSPIADIHGTRSGDEMFLHALRHLAIARPEAYAVENVPGMRAFPVVMEAMTRMPDYFVQVFCPIASSTWLPQRRDRLIIIGSKRSFAWRPPEAGKAVALADILEQDPQVTLPKAIANRMQGKYRDQPSYRTRPGAISPPPASPTTPRTRARGGLQINGFPWVCGHTACASGPDCRAYRTGSSSTAPAQMHTG